jgi:hypothetical protein
MDNTALAVIVTAILGAGGLSGLIPTIGANRRANQQQPVDQYAQLVTTMQMMLDRERGHCDEKIAKIDKEHEECTKRHLELTEAFGRLNGRLDEQRHAIATTVAHTKENAEKIEMVVDQTLKGPK